MKRITEDLIHTVNYQTLIQFCKELGVVFQNQPKEKLKELLLDRLSSQAELFPAPVSKTATKKIVQRKPVPVKKAEKTTEGKKETKSSKILALYLKGKKVSEISKVLKAHPSFCYTVIGKRNK